MVKVNIELTRVKVMVNVFVEVLSKEGKLQCSEMTVNSNNLNTSELNVCK